MRKIIYKSIVALSILGGISSCQSILEEKPKYENLTSEFISNEENLSSVVNTAYKVMIDIKNPFSKIGGSRFRSFFLGADDWTAPINKTTQSDADRLNVSSSNKQALESGWEMCYDVILQANYAVDGGTRLLEADPTNKAIASLTGEAHFLRAWGYFNLVRLFGDVPIVLTHIYDSNAEKPQRDSQDKVYAQILSDLNFAVNNLPDTQPNKGKVTKWGALAMRSKVYLTMTGWPLKETQYYTNALQDAETIINEGPFALEKTFDAIFDIENEKTNTENIWQIVFASNDDFPGKNTYTPFASQLTKPTEIGGWPDLYIEKTFYQKFPEGARKRYTFLESLTYKDGTVLPWQDFNLKHPFLSKFYSGSVDKSGFVEDIKSNTKNSAGNDLPMFRISEILLIYAEAQVNGGGGDATKALEYLNQVRRRGLGVDPFTPHSSDLTTFNQKDIIDERGWEFVGEQKRWFDLIRTETLADALSDRASDENALIKDPNSKECYLMPIPDLELQMNSNLTQNKGY